MPEAILEVAAANHKLAGKYLTLTLNGETYGIDVLKVREIIRLTNITTVPQLPAFVRGVINLRGKIIPVMDLRLRFGMPEARHTEQTCIVVARVKLAKGTMADLGLIVDAVEEVLNLAAAEIEETPEFGAKVNTEMLLGIAKVKAKVITLLDIDRIVTLETTDLAVVIPK